MTKTVAINGIEIHYEDVGGHVGEVVDETVDPEAAGGDALPLVLLHGFTGHRDDFAQVWDALAVDRRVLVPDLRGHGNASRRPGLVYDFATGVEDLRAFLASLGIERCHLLGHSMGGMLVLRFVLAHPESVASLILMNTAPSQPEGLEEGPLRAGAAIAHEHGMGGLQRRIEAATRAAGDPPPYRERWGERYWEHQRRRYHAMDPAAYDAFGRAMVEQSSLLPRLGEIRCPTLVIVGEDDATFLEGADAMQQHIPDTQRVTIPDSEHHPHEENREAWLDAVREHLNRQKAAG